MRQVLIFKLEEEGNTALLHHLPVLLAETADFGSASGLGCVLVVAIVQPAKTEKQRFFTGRYLLEKRGKTGLSVSKLRNCE